jgi:putative transposase
MTRYRRNFVPGGGYFFTVNLDDRRSHLLIEHVDLLRAAFRYARARHPFTVEATVVLPVCMPFGHCPREMPISPCAGG